MKTYKLLKTVRVVLAALMLVGITALLTDATGLLRHWLGWMPKVQLLPAVLALNVVVVVVVLAATALVGRAYCSLVCPMGIFQDIFVWTRRLLLPKRKYAYRPPQNWVRYGVLALFMLLMVLGLNGIAVLLAPYSAYARIVTHIHGTGLVHWVAVGTLACVGVMSFLWGRLWCNTLCPVGTTLGLLSRHSFWGISIDTDKCVGCHRCEQDCKAMCIDIEGGKRVDGSRCVLCLDCLTKCHAGAIGLTRRKLPTAADTVDGSRRRFVAGTAAVVTAMAVEAQEQKMDGGMAVLMNRQVPRRKTPIVPFGARSLKHFSARCTACQLCVSQCPEKVLRPSTDLQRLMQPEMNYKDGYCRLACTRCGEVCPAGAIEAVDKEEKTGISIGIAITLHANCVSAKGGQCGACVRHCPSGAVMMVEREDGRQVPVVNESRCIGCGACEYYCPARPQTAIYVEGREVHAEA